MIRKCSVCASIRSVMPKSVKKRMAEFEMKLAARREKRDASRKAR